jgi:hypothetical protein
MRQRSLWEQLQQSFDPVAGRRLLDQIEFGGVRRGGRSRRVSARMVPPGQSYEKWLAANGYAGMDRQIEGVFGRE